MSEDELLYYFPYRIDKELNFKHFAKDHTAFVSRYLPNYDGTNVEEFIANKTAFSQTQINEFNYIHENYSSWKEWFNNGRNIFSFSKDLLLMLERTDVSEITPDSFHLPFDVFYLSLKPLNIKISKSRDEIIQGVYIDYNIWNSMGEHPDGYCDLSFYFVGDFKDIYAEFLPNVKSRLEFTTGQYDEMPLGSYWNVWLNFEKKVGRENIKQTIDYFITGLKDEIFPRKDSQETVTDYELDFYNSSIELLDNTLNLVINCLLYLSQPNERMDIEYKMPKGLPSNLDKKLSFAKTQKELKKIENKYEQLGFTKIHFVGQAFKRTHSNLISGSSIQTHWRRGHWRNQKFGEKLKESKMIWILPTIVNNDKGEPTKGHVYTLKERTTNR